MTSKDSTENYFWCMNHEYFMQRCINLAKNGLGHTSPNPMVGCVIVVNNQIIGEGYHTKAGMPHAEVEAINSVNNKELLKKATIYVSLEPCSHFGKTPPCSNLIIQHKIPKVVVGSTDPNPQVAGSGIKRLQENGIEVISGILQNECNQLNKRFFTYHTQKRPFIMLKWAQTQDGFIDKERANDELPLKITSKNASRWVHQQRATEDAILIGKSTLLKDNPSLTTRLVGGKNPIPIVLGWPTEHLDFKLLNLNQKVLVINETPPESNANIELINQNPKDLKQVLNELYKREIQSVLVEGGTTVLQSFIDNGFWDEVHVFENRELISKGINAPAFDFKKIGQPCRLDEETLWYCTKS